MNLTMLVLMGFWAGASPLAIPQTTPTIIDTMAFSSMIADTAAFASQITDSAAFASVIKDTISVS